jgi:hypothetical protein
MTTASQIKKLIKPVIEGHSDLGFADGWIILKPVNHVARGISLDRTGQATRFKPKWSVTHLFDQVPVFPLTLGGELYNRQFKLWIWNQPGLQEQLCGAIETEVLPLLREMDTLQKYVTFVEQHQDYGWNKRPLRRILVEIAMGNFDEARSICRDVISKFTPETFPGDAEDKAHFAELKKLCALLADDDRKGLAKMLHAWEAQTVKNLKLEKLWQPTPFPFELQAQPAAK